MPIDYGPEFTTAWGGNPPGLSAPDLELWHRWRPTYAPAYKKFWFNVRLMPDLRLPPNTPPEITRMALANSAKRIDVLARIRDTIEIIELRKQAGLSVIGHLEGYRDLLLRDAPDFEPVQLLLVTDVCEDQLRYVAEKHGVLVTCV